MLFGSKTFFAIEVEVTAVQGGSCLGGLLVWVGDRSFGDSDDSSDLTSSARWGRVFLRASSQRTRLDLEAKSVNEALYSLHGRYVGRQETWAGPWDRDPYVLDEFGEASLRDRVTVVVVRRGDGVDRLIVQDLTTNEVQELLLEPGVCDKVIGEYCNWVEEACSMARTPNEPT